MKTTLSVLCILLLLSLAMTEQISPDLPTPSNQSQTEDIQTAASSEGPKVASSNGFYEYSILLQRLIRMEELFKIQTQKVKELEGLVEGHKKKIDQLQNHFERHHKSIIPNVLEHIKKNGLRLGNRWIISEEGTGSYEALVFRDLKFTQAGIDRRYAMFQGRYTNL